MKHCSRCNETKPRPEFYRNRKSLDGLTAACKACIYGLRQPYVREAFEDGYIPVTESGCWIWMRATDKNGYGVMQGDDKLIRAHAWSYLSRYGQIPQGWEIDHKCRVRCCVNPYHLEAVTHRENVIRGDAGHHMKTRTDFSFLKHPPAPTTLTIQ